MSSVKSSWSKWSPVSVAFLALAAFAIPALGQEAANTSAQGGSYVDDWSHHHLVYSNPGTREDAVKNGKLDKWLKITSDPRYQLQLAKRKMGTLPVVADPRFAATEPDLTMAEPNLATETVDAVGDMAARPVAPAKPRPVRKNPIEKDWSQPLGGAITSLVSALAATNSSSTVGPTSTITVGTQTFTTAAPATATSGLASIASGGLSSSNIAGTSTLTFNTPTSVAFDASPPVAQVSTITVNTNNYCIPTSGGVSVGTASTHVTTNGTAPTGGSITTASGSGSVGMSLTIGGVTYVWESTLATTGCGTTLNCLLGGLTGTSGHAADAEALYRAVNNAGSCVDNGTTTCYVLATGQGANAAATASHTAGADSTSISTWKCAGAATAQWVTNSCGTGETCTAPTGGSAGSGAANIIMPSTMTAGNLATAINTAIGGSAATGFTKTFASPTITLTASAPGSTGFTNALVGSVTGVADATTTPGSDGTTSVASANPELFAYWSGNTYVSPSTLAGTITGLINLNSTLNPLVTATQGTGGNTNQITIAADIPGPSANITVTPSSNFSAFTGGSLSGGTNGPGDTATTFNYWGGQGTTSTYDTGTQLATDLHNALAANGTVLTTDGITTTAGANQITFVTSKAGPFGVSVTNFPAFTGAGSISNAAVTAAVQPNAYPAKYGASLTTANCATDFMVYPTGVAGSATSANIIAYNNLYSSCGNSPTVYWAYNTEYQSNTGYSVTTSPVLSADGTKVAFIESNGSNAYLIVVRWATGGTPGITNPVAPTLATNITTCTAPCMTATQLNFNDNLSSPFYNYNTVGGDEIYVGDTSGNLEQFTGVFNGAVAISTSPWPKNLGAAAITSPILDQGVGVIVVGDMAGALHFVTASNGAIQGTAPGIGDAIIDAPLVDPSTSQVFVFVNVSGSYSETGYNAVYQYPIGYSGSTIGTPGVLALWSAGGANGLAAHYIYSGNFDNVYFNSANGTGNMYVVANTGVTTGGTLFKVSITGGSLQVGGVTAAATGLTASGAYPWPSPLTEFYNSNTSTDYVFFSVNRGAVGSCAPGTGNGCIMSYNVTNPASVTPSGEQNYPNPIGNGCWATSGIVIDNASGTTGASQIYFVDLNGAAAGYPGTLTSSACGAAIAATLQGIQASQPAP